MEHLAWGLVARGTESACRPGTSGGTCRAPGVLPCRPWNQRLPATLPGQLLSLQHVCQVPGGALGQPWVPLLRSSRPGVRRGPPDAPLGRGAQSYSAFAWGTAAGMEGTAPAGWPWGEQRPGEGGSHLPPRLARPTGPQPPPPLLPAPPCGVPPNPHPEPQLNFSPILANAAVGAPLRSSERTRCRATSVPGDGFPCRGAAGGSRRVDLSTDCRTAA